MKEARGVCSTKAESALGQGHNKNSNSLAQERKGPPRASMRSNPICTEWTKVWLYLPHSFTTKVSPSLSDGAPLSHYPKPAGLYSFIKNQSDVTHCT